MSLIGLRFPLDWLPDETLFSICSRYHRLSGNHLAATTCRALFGHPTQGCAHDFPSRIGHFVEVTGGVLGDADAIIRDRTVLPFYLPFSRPEVGAAACEAMKGSSIGSLKFQLGMLTSRFRANHPLKSCPECVAEDTSRHRTAYWHREHQIPGVWACLRHGEWLHASDLKASGVGRFHWILPAACDRSEQQPVGKAPERITALSRSAALMTASMFDERLELPRVRLAYKSALGKHDLLGGGSARHLRHEQIGRAYAEINAPFALIDQLAGLPVAEAQASKEVARLTRATSSGIHPVRHLALISWLFHDFDDFMFIYREGQARVGSWGSEKGDAIERRVAGADARRAVVLELVASGRSISAAARSVGADPATGMAWAAAAGIGTKKRPSVVKEVSLQRMIIALERGATKEVAARFGDVSISSVTRLLRTEVGLREKWRTARFANELRRCRRRWLRIMMANPHSGVKVARLMEPAVYAWLYRNDRDWLSQQAEQMTRMIGSRGLRIDWDLRDAALAEEVRRVALELQDEHQGSRTSLRLWQIYQRLPELKAKLAKLDRLPLTRAAILRAVQFQA